MIDRFSGQYRWLSNFWPADVSLDGVVYPTVEHAYQAAKTLDPAERERIRLIPGASAAKRLSHDLDVRDDWGRIRVRVMRELLQQKFSHPELRQKLLATGKEVLVEGNTWGDTFWGVCAGKGENRLGRLLMEIRDDAQLSLFD